MASGFGQPMMPPGRGRDDEAVMRATSALNGGRAIEAERMAADLLKAKPDHPRALHILGYALIMQGRAQDAIAALEPAVRRRHDAELDTELAIALRRVGRTDDAQARLKRAIKRQPPFAAAFYELGCLLSSLERYDEAADVFRRGLDGAPMMPELSIELGLTLLAGRNPGDAVAAFAQALSISPNAPDALHGMANACQEAGRHREAATYFRRYLVTKPDHWSAWLGLGHSLLELGDRDAGYDCFRTAARGDAHCGHALSSLVKAAHGRFWLRPSTAAQFLKGTRA